MGAIIAVINKRGENAKETAVAMLETLKHEGIEALGIASFAVVKIEKSIEALQSQYIDSSIVVGQAFSKVFPSDKPQPMRLENAGLVFEGRIYPTTKEISDAEIVARALVAKKFAQKETVKNLVSKSDGCFSFAIAEPNKIIASRDIMGVHPFYYGENADFVALASERKALWRIGIKTAESFPPGCLAIVDKKGFRFKPVRTLAYSEVKQITMQNAAKKLQKLLQHSIKERVSESKEVAVAFSGGLDSSIIALLAGDLGLNVHLICVSLQNQPEIEHAKRAADCLRLPIHMCLYSEEDVEKALSNVLWLIEEPDFVKASVGIPFFWTAEKTAEMDFKVILAGQGADELFGGYKRYRDDYLRYGSEKVQKEIFQDIVRMYKTNLERDFKICNFHNLELRLPFATYQLAKFAIGLPVELKIDVKEDELRKLVLRQTARNLGLPQFIVEKPKKAIQYATGVSKTLKKLAKREDLPIKEYLRKTFQTIVKERLEK